MSLRVVGAGLPRTGTTSLKTSLELLLDGPCYHMFELFERVEAHGLSWWAALNGEVEKTDEIFDGWAAAVDWPTSILWKELAERHPDALVVLSHRGSADTWWTSADATVWESMRRLEANPDGNELFLEFNRSMRARSRFSDDLHDADAAKARYDEHFEEVVATIPDERLLIWKPSDGFGPLCERLDLPVPDTPTIQANTRAEFLARMPGN